MRTRRLDFPSDALYAAYAKERRLLRALRFNRKLLRVLTQRCAISAAEYRALARLDKLIALG